MRYAGEPLDVAFFPLALERSEVAALRSTVESAMRLLERATRAWLADPEMQAAYGWPAERVALVRHDPGYARAIPCARFDSYWDGHVVRFLEVNTDGTSGMTNVERVTAFFLEEPGLAPLRARFGLKPWPLRDAVLAALLECWAEFREGRPGAPREPRIAIVDWREVKTRAEFEAFRRWFESRGLRATVRDPRDLRFDGRTLSDEEGAIDLVYRRLVSTEVHARRADVEPLIAAYLARAVCVVGSFRSDVAFDKRLFALLQDPRFARHFDEEDRALVRRHFAPTWILRRGPGSRDLIARAKRDRERYVLKPAALYEGRGVILGVETEPAAWEVALDAAGDGDHVLQERIEAPPATELEACAAGAAGLPCYLSLGEYVFGGKLAGFNARVASTLVLSAAGDERLLPVVALA